MTFAILGANSITGGDTEPSSFSIRGDKDSSHALGFTPSSAGSATNVTISFWVKRSTQEFSYICHSYPGGFSNRMRVHFNTSGTIGFDSGGSSGLGRVETTSTFNDSTVWYHIVAVMDSPNATATERMRIYVNGTQQSITTGAQMTQNSTAFLWNQTYEMDILGRDNRAANDTLLISNFHSIDGQSLEPSEFAETVSSVWRPKEYTGTYGNNGFFLKFDDNADLGADSSGNDNDFTTYNLNSYDQLIDNPLDNNFQCFDAGDSAGFGSGELKEGALFVDSGGSAMNVNGTLVIPSGQWYWEIYIGSNASGGVIGIGKTDINGTALSQVERIYGYSPNGNKYENTSGSSYGATYGAGDIIGVKYNGGTGALEFLKNNVSQGTAFNVTLVYGPFVPQIHLNNMDVYANFGQDGTFAGNVTAQGNSDGNGVGDFYYSVPSGHLALCEANGVD